MQHRIRISPSGGDKYRVNGACDIFDTGAPILDAARAIRDAGAAERDTLHVFSSDFTWSPVTLHAILKPRQKPRSSDIENQQRHGR